MKLLDAYQQALDENDDPTERGELTDSIELKTIIIEEIMESMKEIRNAKADGKTPVDLVKPLFTCVAFWFIIGIRVGKILRDQELAAK